MKVNKQRPPRRLLKRVGLSLLILLVLFALAMSHWRGRSFVFSVAFDIPFATHDIRIDRDIFVEGADGVRLATDVYFPEGTEDPPTILMRTTYGKTRESTEPFAYAFARRGYMVVAQDARGTGHSTGDFAPFEHERKDGAATIAWLRDQQWFNGDLGLFGLSYVGFTALATASDNPPEVKGVFAPVTARNLHPLLHGNGGFNLDLALSWAEIVSSQDKEDSDGPSIIDRLLGDKPEPIDFTALPILTADEAVTGERVSFYREFVTSIEADDPYWRAASLSDEDIAGIEAPVYLATAWHDAALPEVIKDYQILRDAGRDPQLKIGSGPHIDVDAILRYLRDGLAFFDHHLKGQIPDEETGSVIFERLGDGSWISLDEWPLNTEPTSLYLTNEGALSPSPNSLEGQSTTFTFDPSNPTPAYGGALLATTEPVLDNARFEARSDTIVFTSAPFAKDMDVIGRPRAQLMVSSDQPTFDVFVRLSRVGSDGVSRNITDGALRVNPIEGVAGAQIVDVALLPTAIRITEGERLRLLIAGGAHPWIARNLGRGSTLEQASQTEMQVIELRVHHDRTNVSSITLPTIQHRNQVN